MSASIIAKFQCESVTHYSGSESVHLRAATGKGNEMWSRWTPSGEITMSISNDDARGAFKAGYSYLLTFVEEER